MKNLIFLVIDSLSHFHLSQYQKEGGGFSKIRNHSLVLENMYSAAPFTAGALRGLLASENVFEHSNYLYGDVYSKKSLFDLFHEEERKIYLNRYDLVDCGFISQDNLAQNYDLKGMLFLRFYVDDIDYFSALKKNNQLSEADYTILLNKLSVFFQKYQHLFQDSHMEKLYMDCLSNPHDFIDELLTLNGGHSPFPPSSKNLYEEFRFEVSDALYSVDPFWETESGLKLDCGIRRKNRILYSKMNRPLQEKDPRIREKIEKVLNGKVYNRYLYYNSNIDLYDKNRKYSELEEEMKHFLQWADGRQESGFFAYIHTFDFHYPEFSNRISKIKDNSEQVAHLLKEIEDIDNIKMSVTQFLQLQYLDEQLNLVYSQLQSSGLLENSYVVLTADHGHGNPMYPVTRENLQAYYGNHFHVPCYLFGNDIIPGVDHNFYMQADLLPTFAKLCGLDTKGGNYMGTNIFAPKKRSYVTAEWINGVPDLMRKPIKFGIRDSRCSLTYIVGLSQFFSSGKLFTLFDLENDPEETINLAGQSDDRMNRMVKSLLLKVKDRWYEILCHYLFEADLPELYANPVVAEYMKTASISLMELDHTIFRESSMQTFLKKRKRPLYLVGTGSETGMFLEKYGSKCAVLGILDETNQSGEIYSFGYQVTNLASFLRNNREEADIVVTAFNEMETVIQVQQSNLYQCYTFGCINNSCFIP